MHREHCKNSSPTYGKECRKIGKFYHFAVMSKTRETKYPDKLMSAWAESNENPHDFSVSNLEDEWLVESSQKWEENREYKNWSGDTI